MNPRTELITQLTNEIAVRQDVIKALHALDVPAPETASRGSSGASPHRESEKSPRRAKPKDYQRLNVSASGLSQRPGGPSQRKAPTPIPDNPRVEMPLDRPNTIGGAMKVLIRAGEGRFVPSQLWDVLRQQYPELVTADDARVRFNGNLSNWVYTGKLDKESRDVDAACKWTAVGKEWFNA